MYVNTLAKGSAYAPNNSSKITVCREEILYENEVYYEYACHVQITASVAINTLKSNVRNVTKYESPYDIMWSRFLDLKEINKSNTDDLHDDVYFDALTSKNLAMERNFNFYSEKYRDIDYLLFLNVYLGVNSILFENYEGQRLLTDYYTYDEDIETFYIGLQQYSYIDAKLRDSLTKYLEKKI